MLAHPSGAARSRLPMAAAFVFVVLLPTAAPGEPISLWVRFSQKHLAPNTVCNGKVSAQGGRLLSVTPVLFESEDSLTGSNWNCSVQGTREVMGKRRRVNVMPRDKGLVVTVDGQTQVTLDTAIGRAQFDADTMPWHSPKPVLDGKLTVQRVPAVARLTTDATEDEFPGITCDRSGRLWAAWQSWDTKADAVYVTVREAGVWAKPTEVTEGPADVYQVRLAPRGQAGVWAVWAEQQQGNWDLWALPLPRQPDAKPLRLTSTPGADFNHKLVASPRGQVWLVWQSERGGQYDIFAARLTDSGIESVTAVTEHPANDWDPSATFRADGTLFIAWDTYRDGSYDVYLRSLSAGRLSPSIGVACTDRYEAHADVACDPKGRPWVVWDAAGPYWGKDRPKARLLHSKREVQICCLDGDRRLVPSPPLASCVPPELAGMWELPKIAFASNGAPVVLFRTLARIRRWRAGRAKPERQSRGIWAYFATVHDGNAWSRPILLPGTEGRNDQRPDLVRDRQARLWVASAGDGRNRTRAEIPGNNNVNVFAFPAFAGSGVPPALEPAATSPEPVDLTEPARKPYRIAVGGESYHLIYGDLHRHTDMSRCNMCGDGSLLDTYRYGIDAVRLDFLGISDHDQDILKHRYDRETRPLQGYMWWRSEKLCDLFLIRERFVPIYGYEHGGSMRARGGHKNVMYVERGQPCIEDDAPQALFAALKGKYAVAIPHQLADGGSATDWDKWNREFETVAEIFQARGSYEYLGCPRPARIQKPNHHYWDALAKGLRVGVIASSDHGLTHGAYAGLYVKERTRRGIIEALKARRTFGATDTIVLDFRVGEHPVGSAVALAEAPALRAYVRGTAEIKRVDVVKDNQFVYTFDPAGDTYEFSFTDVSLKPGQKAYYYLRCLQNNREIAWSSPIWVERK